MNKILVVLFNDRHFDPDVEIFTDVNSAVNYAREYAQGRCKNKKYYEESKIDGWIFHANYNGESDYVCVFEKLIDSEIK